MPLSPSTKTPQVRASIVFGSQGAAPGSAALAIIGPALREVTAEEGEMVREREANRW